MNKTLCPNCSTECDELITVSGTEYCEECVPKNYNCCEHCGELFEIEDITYVDDEPYCSSCRDIFFIQCVNCDDYIERRAAIHHDREAYCEQCFNDEFSMCDNCGEYYLNEETYYQDRSRRTLCECCWTNDNSDLPDYDYQPDWIYHKVENEVKPLYFGVELEAENIGLVDMNETVDKLPAFVFAKKDGSLDNGVEVVTHPFSWEWFIKHKSDVSRLLAQLRTKGFRSYNTKTCGIHVHLSKRAFSTLHFFRFLTFFYASETNKEFILKISQRLTDNVRHWCSLWDTKTKDLVYKIKDGRAFERYTAVNTQPSHTYEVRIFRGTLNFKSFCKNLEFCYAVYNWTAEFKDTPFIESLKLLTYKNLVKYIRLHRDLYPNLLHFIEKNNLCA